VELAVVNLRVECVVRVETVEVAESQFPAIEIMAVEPMAIEPRYLDLPWNPPLT
jgi:hypothetical protein